MSDNEQREREVGIVLTSHHGGKRWQARYRDQAVWHEDPVEAVRIIVASNWFSLTRTSPTTMLRRLLGRTPPTEDEAGCNCGLATCPDCGPSADNAPPPSPEGD